MTTAVSRPPLVRSSDRVIAGVCAGLARHLGWPVRMVRIGMAVAALAGGAGVAFYAWLWIMVPTADESAKRNARQPASPIAPAVSAPYRGARRSLRRRPTAPAGAGRHPALPPVPHVRRPRDARPGRFRGGARVPGMRYGKEILLGAGLLLAAGILIARAARRRRAAGDAHPGRGHPGRRGHRLDAAGRDAPGRPRGQDQGGPGRRLGPSRGRAGPRGGRRPGHGVRLRVLGADLACPAGLRGGARRRGPGAAALGAEVLAGPGGGARRPGPRHRTGRDRRPPARLRAADPGPDPAARRQRDTTSSGWPAPRNANCGAGCTGIRARKPGSSPKASRPPRRRWKTPWATPSRWSAWATAP